MKNNIISSNLSLYLNLHNPQAIFIPIQQKYPRSSLSWRYFREIYVARAFSRNPPTTYWNGHAGEKKRKAGFAIACKTRYRNFRRHVLRITERGLDRFRKQPAQIQYLPIRTASLGYVRTVINNSTCNFPFASIHSARFIIEPYVSRPVLVPLFARTVTPTVPE